MPVEYSINVTAGQGGGVAVEVDGETVSKAIEGESVTLTATPGEGYEFDRWSVESGGVELSGNPAAFSMPAADVSVKAEFREKSVTAYAINIIAGEHGEAVATIGGERVAEAVEGAEVTLAATPDEEYLFDKWTTQSEWVVFGDDEAVTTTFIMPAADVEIRAEFIFDPDTMLKRPIVLTDDGNGTAVATVDGEEVTEAARGAEITLMSSPAEGYVFGRWTAVSGGVEFEDDEAATTTFIMPATEVEIAVEFISESEFDVLSRITDLGFKSLCEYFMQHDYYYNHHWDGQIRHPAWDTNGDGRLSIPEAGAVKIITHNGDVPIVSLDGIEYFKGLEILECGGNSLTELDLSGNTALRDLHCSSNLLTELDLSNNRELRILYCNYNRLTTLDLSNNTELYRAVECNNNLLTSIDVSGCTKLVYLDCINNFLTSLDVSTNTSLWTLLCCGNRMSSLDITSMAMWEGNGYALWCGLQRVDDTTPQLMTLTMREDQKPEWYRTASEPYDHGNATSPNMYVVVDGDPVDIFELIPDPAFRAFCDRFDLVKDGVFSVAEVLRTKMIHISDPEIMSLEGIKYFTELTRLSCDQSPVSAIDVSGLEKLGSVVWSSNQLTTLDISGCTALVELVVFGNRLTTLDASEMVEPADYILCGQQTSDGSTPQTLTLTLREEQKPRWYSYFADYSGGFNANVVLEGGVADVFDVITDPAFRTYCEQFDTDGDGILTEAEARAVTLINAPNAGIASLAGIEYFTEITVINLPNNQLTGLDVSSHTKLTDLICHSNRLTTLDISGCTSLSQMIVFNNRMTALDASGMANPSGYIIMCGRQTSDGTTAQTLTLSLRDEQEAHWDDLKNAPENGGVVLAD